MSAVRNALKLFTLSARERGYPERGGPVRARVEDANDLRTSECRHLLILVHGFNNTRSAAQNSYELMLAGLEEHFAASRSAPDAVALFHWPGNAAVGLWGLADFAGYPVDVDRARKSAECLAEYLGRLPQAAGAPGSFKITFIGHSLGCRLICELLEKLDDAVNATVELASLMAPAVPVQLVDELGDLRRSVAGPRRILKFFSDRDTVLGYAFPSGQLAAYLGGTEPALYSEAVGYYGNPTAMGIPCPSRNRHGEYWGDRSAAAKYVAAIDPTFYRLPAPRELGGRALPSGAGLADRALSGVR